MKGWREAGHHSPSGESVWKCEAPLCGALVREGAWEDDHSGGPSDERRREHDRQFHLLRAERGGPNDGYTLHLDGKEIGYAYDNVQHYNLRRALTTHTWTMQTRGQVVISPWQGKFRRSMAYFLGHLDGAKAWGIGANPQRWYYPEER